MSPAAPATLFPAPEDEYPVRDAGPLTKRELVWLLALTLLALVPRALVAARLGAVCDDGYFYLAVADAYERGDFTATLHYLNINVYPVLLAGLHRLGLDPVAGAKIWGVLAGGLVVPPLFGWLRRMFDARIAAAACLLYALHSEFIELSAEPIRDGTCWLFTAWSLYFLWRAAAEGKFRLYAAAGLSIALAAHTRTEGWLLALPAVVWPVFHAYRAGTGMRLKTAAGLLLCAAMTPAFIAAFNLTALAGHSRWEWGRLEPLSVAVRWLGGEDVTAVSIPPVPVTAPAAGSAAAALPATVAVPPSTVPAATPAPPTVAISPKPPEPRPAHRSKFVTYFRSLGHALEPIPLLLMLVGVAARPRLLRRADRLVLLACSGAVFAAVAFRLASLGEINGRYFLLCFFSAAPAAGIGLLAALNFLERRWTRYLTRPRPATAVAALVAVAGFAQAGEAVSSRHPSRETESRLGQAVADRFGRDRSILVVPQACRVGYFAAGHLPAVMIDLTPIDDVLIRNQPELVILEREDTPRAEFDFTLYCLELRGMRRYDLAGLPGGDRFALLTAPGVAPRTDAPPRRPLGLARRDGR